MNMYNIDINMNKNDTNMDKIDSFNEMKLNKHLLKGIVGYGFEKPSLIQYKSIPNILNGRNIIAQSQSGTGKTGSFVIGILEKCDYTNTKIQTIIISPTRELAIQTHDIINTIGKYISSEYKRHLSLLCIGGIPIRNNIENIYKKKPLILTCTPGRIVDLIRRNKVDIKSIDILVMDEVDELFSKGFYEQTNNFFKDLKEDVQIILFSATLTQNILKIFDRNVPNPVKILINRDSLSLEGIKQYYIILEDNELKNETVIDLYDIGNIAQSVIFCNTKKNVENLTDQLVDKNFSISSIHGDLTKNEREEIMENFKENKSRVLVTSDLISRGIDIHHINLVINYDMPSDKEVYLHRIGRCGRYGRKGIAINFIKQSELYIIKIIEGYYNITISELSEDFFEYLQ